MSTLSIAFAPKTEGFWRNNILAALGIGISAGAAFPFRGLTLTSMVIQATIVSIVYLGWSWIVGLFNHEDLQRIRPRPKTIEGPEE